MTTQALTVNLYDLSPTFKLYGLLPTFKEWSREIKYIWVCFHTPKKLKNWMFPKVELAKFEL